MKRFGYIVKKLGENRIRKSGGKEDWRIVENESFQIDVNVLTKGTMTKSAS